MAKQMTHFGNAWGKQRSRRCWSRLARWKAHLGANADQEAIGQHHERDMPVPCRPAANLILVQTHVFRVFKILFNMPPGSRGLTASSGLVWKRTDAGIWAS